MSSVLVPWALTTTARVAARLDFTADSTQTTLLENLVNECTDFIEGQTNRRFLFSKYTNELYSVIDGAKQVISTIQAPISYLDVVGSVTASSTGVTLTASNGRIKVGMPISGDGIAAGTTVAAINTTALTLSQVASATSATASLQIFGVTSAQYRAGTPSNPAWTSFIQDQFEMVSNGDSGLVRIYGNIFGINNTRLTYWAGYLIDFGNLTDATKHTLPFDLSGLCERLTVRMWKRRFEEATKSTSISGMNVTWTDLCEAADLEILGGYQRIALL